MCVSTKKYDVFPLRIVLARLSLLIIFLISGLAVMRNAGFGYALVYALFAAGSLVHVLFFTCRNCDYYGKRCDTGFGIATAFLFKKGGGETAFKRSFKYILPPLLILAAAPFITGMVLMLSDFKPEIPAALALFGASLGAIVYTSGKWCCPHCRMQPGCPFALVKKSE